MLHIEIRLSQRGTFVAYAVDDFGNTWAGFEAGDTGKMSEAADGLKKLLQAKFPDKVVISYW
jgi:hypothetical protein